MSIGLFMDISNKYTSVLGEVIKKRFKGIDIGFREIRGYNSSSAIDWKYKGIECKANFYSDRGKLFFYMELEVPKREGLVERIGEESISNRKIDKVSRFLTRPHREIFEGKQSSLSNPNRICYKVHCRIKQNLANLDPDKNPEIVDLLIADIWGYLMREPIGFSTGMID